MPKLVFTRKAPTADEIWTTYRDTSWADLAAIVGMGPKAMREAGYRMGFRRSSAPGTPLTHAPCRECGRKYVPVEELDADRTCWRCVERRRQEPAEVPEWKIHYERELPGVRARREQRWEEIRQRMEEIRERQRAAGLLREDRMPVYVVGGEW